VNATLQNLTHFFKSHRPGAIHFSGHAVSAEDIRKENKSLQPLTDQSDTEIEQIYLQGDALVLENEKCEAQYLHAE
jgi:hypothetical protein